MSATRGLNWAQRAVLWDCAARAIRDYLRGQGLRELFTPARVCAPAIEPWIDVLPAPPGHLRTSPELAIKRLLARKVGSCFELAKVFRAGEIGDWHREEFHLLEWYRVAPDHAAASEVDAQAEGESEAEAAFEQLPRDVEAIVACVAEAVAAEPSLAGELGGEPALTRVAAPRSWEGWSFDDVWRETTGQARPADTLEALEAAALDLRRVSPDMGSPLLEGHGQRAQREVDADVDVLVAWSELFSWWTDLALDPWLEARAREGVGVHVSDFPAPLAALSQVHATAHGPRARRFESFIGRVELANGYLELRDASEQRRRFERVSAMRARASLPPLPLDEGFLADVGELPACAGVALGFERVLAWAVGASRLDELDWSLDGPHPIAPGGRG